MISSVRALWRVGWSYLRRHKSQSALMVLGIALGVAVVVSIDFANASAQRAFDLSAESVAGKATHQIVAGPGGLDEGIYTRLRTAGIAAPLTPIISDYVSSPQMGNRPFQLLGVDPFSDAPFQNYLEGSGGLPLNQLTGFFSQPGAVLISRDLAERYGLSPGSHLTLDVGGRRSPALVVGLLIPADSLARQTLDGLILTDIATAQELTGRLGRLDRIDVILPSGDSPQARAIRSLLPSDYRLVPSAMRSGTVDQMTAAFRTNLTALSLLALVVGLFLIYNTMTFSVVQRRSLFGTLRCLGVTRKEIFAIVLGEALMVGVLGSTLGIFLGVWMGGSTVRAIIQTINDLYFATTVTATGVPAASLVKGALVGVLATLLTTIPPAWEASTVPPFTALASSELEGKARRGFVWISFGGVMMLIIGVGIFLIPAGSLWVGFSGTLAVILGFAMLTASGLALMMRMVAPVTGRLFGVVGRLAPRSVVNSLSRTAVAVAALMVAVAVSAGVGLMIASFRYTVIAWLSQTLQGDIYISAPGFTAARPGPPIDANVIQAVKRWPGVAEVDLQRSTMVDSPVGQVQVSATDNAHIGAERLFVNRMGDPALVWSQMEQGGVLVSEPLAYRLNLPRSGGAIRLYTDVGEHSFPVVGIYYDYSSNEGMLMMTMDVYHRYWHDNAVTAIALRLAPGVNVESTTRALQEGLSRQQSLIIRANQTLRNDVLAVFDRTFAITGALQVLATIVAFIGVLSALMTLQLEKQREAGILRAIGLTARQLWGLVMLESGLMGAAAGLLAVPTGYALCLILVYIINRRSFGWTLQLALTPEPFLQAFGVALAAALLAGILPAYRFSRQQIAETIRYE